jgi:outer membrane lipoprotein-sorting protein
MTRFIGAVLALAFVLGLGTFGRAADATDTNAILNKAIKALGGEEKLSKIKAASWKTKGTITFGGNDNEVATESTLQRPDHCRREFEGDFGGNKLKGVFILAGDKGWRKFGDNLTELDKNGVANEKQTVYLTVIPIIVLPLKSKDFKIAAAPEENVDGKPAVGIKATAPDGKDFTIYFDKDTGLPARIVAKVAGFMGDEYTQETTFGDYREMAGIKKATKIQVKRDGEKFQDFQVTEFKILDKVDPKLFTEPQ